MPDCTRTPSPGLVASVLADLRTALADLHPVTGDEWTPVATRVAHRAGDLVRLIDAGGQLPAPARQYDMHADAHRPMIEPDETIGEYGARCYAAGRDETITAADHRATAAALAHEIADLRSRCAALTARAQQAERERDHAREALARGRDMISALEIQRDHAARILAGLEAPQ